MTEADLRDLLSQNIECLEAGLLLLNKEQYIPNTYGTKSFIDLYATDLHGHHVLIELKRSNASAREALHEIQKYAEGVKQHLGARDDEIRVIVASTEWKELLVPFSKFVSDTSMSVKGLQLTFDATSELPIVEDVQLVPINQGRFILPMHEVHWYSNLESLKSGITSIDEACKAKQILDYVIVILKPEQPTYSEHQAGMWEQIKEIAALQNLDTGAQQPELPTYEYLAYFAMQAVANERCLSIIENINEDNTEILEGLDDQDEEQKTYHLNEALMCLDPRPVQDHLEIGYPAKFMKFYDQYEFEIINIERKGSFLRNRLLHDDSILSELCGEDGGAGQRYKKTISISNRAHLTTAKSNIAKCLTQNPAWRNHVLRALDEISHEFPNAEVDISIFNPETGLMSLYFTTSREDGVLFVPSYTLTVRNPNPVLMYFGGIEKQNTPLSFRQILKKYYENDISGLMTTLSWGGKEDRDVDIINDLGGAYRSFFCDQRGGKHFKKLVNDRWVPCAPTQPLQLFGEFIQINQTTVDILNKKIGDRNFGHSHDASSIDKLFNKSLENTSLDTTDVSSIIPESCAACGCNLHEENYSIAITINAEDIYHCLDCLYFDKTDLKNNPTKLYKFVNGGHFLVME